MTAFDFYGPVRGQDPMQKQAAAGPGVFGRMFNALGTGFSGRTGASAMQGVGNAMDIGWKAMRNNWKASPLMRKATYGAGMLYAGDKVTGMLGKMNGGNGGNGGYKAPGNGYY